MTGTVEAVAAAIDLRAHLRPGDTVVWGQACAEPLTLTRALAEQQPEIGPLRLFLGIGSDATPGRTDFGDSADSADSAGVVALWPSGPPMSRPPAP